MKKNIYIISVLLLLVFTACKKTNSGTHKEDVKSHIDFEEETDDLNDELREFGIIENIEDGAYPFFVVTVNFVERKMKIDFKLNVENISLDINGLYDLVGKYATIYYTSELENNLTDLHVDGNSLLGEYPEFNPDLHKITGVLGGAANVTAGDLPSTLSITDNNGEKMDFEWFIDSEIVKENGKTVTAFYNLRGVHEIINILPSEE